MVKHLSNPSHKGSLIPPARAVKSGGPGKALLGRLTGEVPGPGRLLVALSGGGDSVALLLLLHELAPARGWELGAAHVDHGLRPESEADARFCEKLAESLDLNFYQRRVRVETNGRSPEEAAREARLTALAQMADDFGARTVALGHNADDQAETLLLRLLAGTGPTGLAGMRPNTGLFWRPLLGIRREELRAYLRDSGRKWRRDPSNQEPIYTRNRVRGRILPVAQKEINPRTVEALCRLAGLCAREEDYWQKLCEGMFDRHGKSEGTSLLIAAESLAGLHPAALRRMLRYMAARLTGSGQQLLSGNIDQLADLALGRPGRQLSLPGGLWAGREREHLRLDVCATPPAFATRLWGPGRLDLPHLGKSLVAEITGPPARFRARGPMAWLPLGRVAWPLEVRPPKRGERLQPLGAPGHKLLSRFLMDLKIPLWWRRRSVVVADQKGVWWAAPWSVDERARQKGGESAWLALRLIDTPQGPPYTSTFDGPDSK